MAERWQYTGTGAARSYGDYVDAATGRQLDAEPGGEYEIRTTWDLLPVPPADGWWKPAVPDVAETAVEAPAGKTPSK